MAKGENFKSTIHAKDVEISIVTSINNEDYISLTDIAKYKNPEFPADVIKNWLRVRSTIEFLGLWEQLHNQNFKLVEFDQFKIESGSNSFVLSPQNSTAIQQLKSLTNNKSVHKLDKLNNETKSLPKK